METIAEIKARLGAIFTTVMFWLGRDLFMQDLSLVLIVLNVLILAVYGVAMGFFVTELLVAFKKWWRE